MFNHPQVDLMRTLMAGNCANRFLILMKIHQLANIQQGENISIAD